MRPFIVPRSAPELALAVLRRRYDPELPSSVCEEVMRRIRARVDMLMGSRANEEDRADVVMSLFEDMLAVRDQDGVLPLRFPSIDQFEQRLRRMAAERIGNDNLPA
jgi:hypothetical protein